MNVTATETTILIIAYLNTIAAAKGDPVEDNIFTGPNEERVNKAKQSIELLFTVDPQKYELGDTQTESRITYTFRFGRRDDQDNVAGTGKQLADTFFEDYSRYIRSRQFKTYLATNQVKWMDISNLEHKPFLRTQEGMRKAEITLLVYSYIETLEDIPV